jgi:hypothetical protein
LARRLMSENCKPNEERAGAVGRRSSFKASSRSAGGLPPESAVVVHASLTQRPFGQVVIEVMA